VSGAFCVVNTETYVLKLTVYSLFDFIVFLYGK
jgi:hypothetical protein